MRKRQRVGFTLFVSVVFAGTLSAQELSFQMGPTLTDGVSNPLVRPMTAELLPGLGHIVVADRSDRDIKVYAANGERIGTFGGAGHEEGRFSAITGAFVLGDELVAVQPLTSRTRLTSIDFEGGIVREMNLDFAVFGRPIFVRPVDDSMMLLVHHPAASPRLMASLGPPGLLELVGADRQSVSRFFYPSEYLGDSPVLRQRSNAVADARAGCVFAALAGRSMVQLFDYSGQELGSLRFGPEELDMKVWLISELSSGRQVRSRDVPPNGPFVANILALNGCEALVHVGYHTEEGRMGSRLSGGDVLLVGLDGDELIIKSRIRIDGALLGRGIGQSGLVLGSSGTGADFSFFLGRVLTSS